MIDPRPPTFRFVPVGQPCALEDCPPGVFLQGTDGLGFRTEYGFDVYCLGSGEVFHGSPNVLPPERKRLTVQPYAYEIDYDHRARLTDVLSWTGLPVEMARDAALASPEQWTQIMGTLRTVRDSKGRDCDSPATPPIDIPWPPVVIPDPDDCDGRWTAPWVVEVESAPGVWTETRRGAIVPLLLAEVGQPKRERFHPAIRWRPTDTTIPLFQIDAYHPPDGGRFEAAIDLVSDALGIVEVLQTEDFVKGQPACPECQCSGDHDPDCTLDAFATKARAFLSTIEDRNAAPAPWSPTVGARAYAVVRSSRLGLARVYRGIVVRISEFMIDLDLGDDPDDPISVRPADVYGTVEAAGAALDRALKGTA